MTRPYAILLVLILAALAAIGYAEVQAAAELLHRIGEALNGAPGLFGGASQ